MPTQIMLKSQTQNVWNCPCTKAKIILYAITRQRANSNSSKQRRSISYSSYNFFLRKDVRRNFGKLMGCTRKLEMGEATLS